MTSGRGRRRGVKGGMGLEGGEKMEGQKKYVRYTKKGTMNEKKRERMGKGRKGRRKKGREIERIDGDRKRVREREIILKMK